MKLWDFVKIVENYDDWMKCVVQYPIECFDKMPFETLDLWKKLRKKNFVKSTLIPCCRKFLVRMKNIWLKFTFYPPFSDVLKIFVNLSEIFTKEKKYCLVWLFHIIKILFQGFGTVSQTAALKKNCVQNKIVLIM